MENSIWLGNRNPLSQFMILLGLCLLSVAIFSFLPLLLAGPLFGIDAMQAGSLFNGSTDPNVVALLKFMQLMQSIGMFVVPPLLFAKIYGKKIVDYLSLSFQFNKINLLVMALLMLSAVPLINWLGELNAQVQLPASWSALENWMKQMEREAEQLTHTFLAMESPGTLLLNIVLIALIPAIGEELLFRGAVQRILSEWTKNKHWGIWISALLFSALHLQFYGFIPRMLMGAVLGYSLLWTGSLWVPICGHFVNNASAVLLSYYEQRGSISPEVEHIGESSGCYVWLLLSAVLVGTMIFILKRKTPSEITQTQ